MLTKDTIRKNLINDPYWEPEEISDSEWELFDEVYEEMEKKGELGGDLDTDDGILDLEDDDWGGDEEL